MGRASSNQALQKSIPIQASLEAAKDQISTMDWMEVEMTSAFLEAAFWCAGFRVRSLRLGCPDDSRKVGLGPQTCGCVVIPREGRTRCRQLSDQRKTVLVKRHTEMILNGAADTSIP